MLATSYKNGRGPERDPRRLRAGQVALRLLRAVVDGEDVEVAVAPGGYAVPYNGRGAKHARCASTGERARRCGAALGVR